MHSKLIIHGGFFSESHTNSQVKLAKQKALSDIVNKSFNYLNSHSALETSVYAVSLLEDCELFNAGIGSQIQSDGKIRLSAGLMDGSSGKFSGVINIEDVKNPILTVFRSDIFFFFTIVQYMFFYFRESNQFIPIYLKKIIVNKNSIIIY